MSDSWLERTTLWLFHKVTPSPWKPTHLFRRGLLGTIVVTLLFYIALFSIYPISIHQLQTFNIPTAYLSGIGLFVIGLLASYFRVLRYTESEPEETVVNPSKRRKRVLFSWILLAGFFLEGSYIGIQIYDFSTSSVGSVTITTIIQSLLIAMPLLCLFALFKHLLSVGPSYKGDRRYYVNEYTLLEDKWIEASALLEEGHQKLQNDEFVKASYYFSKAKERYEYLAKYSEREIYRKVAQAHSEASKAYKQSVFDSNEPSKQKSFEKGNFFITKANETLQYRECDTCGFITKVGDIHRAVSAGGVERKLECHACHNGETRTEKLDEKPFETREAVEQEFETVYNERTEQSTEDTDSGESETVTDPYGDNLSNDSDREDGSDILDGEMEELSLDDVSPEEETEQQEKESVTESTTTRTKRRDARTKGTTLDENEFSQFTQQDEDEETSKRKRRREQTAAKPPTESTSGYRPEASNASTKRRQRGTNRGTDVKREQSQTSNTRKRSKESPEQKINSESTATKQKTRPHSQEPVSSAQEELKSEPKTTVEDEKTTVEDEKTDSVENNTPQSNDSVKTKPDREFSDKTDRVTVEWACTVLNIDKPLDEQKIKQAYRREVTRTHPDNGGSTEAFEKVQDAKDRLETYLKYTKQ